MPRDHARYTQRDLFVDGVILAAGLVAIACFIALLRSI